MTLAVLLPSLLFLAACFNAIPYVDPIRDAYQGWLIAQGGQLPLLGPPLAGTVHLGPVWLYLMALPATFASSMLAFSLFVGGLAASKFLLACRLGTELIDRRFGAMFAIMLTIPTWSTFQVLFLTHAALVESAILGTLLVTAWVLRRPGPKRFLLLGLACGLGLHTHPTFLVAALPVAALLFAPGQRFRLRYLPIIAGGALVPFLPALLASLHGAEVALGNLDGYLSSDLGAISLLEMPSTLYSLLITGVQASFGSVFTPAAARAWLALHLVVLGAIAAGAVLAWPHSTTQQRRFLLASLLILIGSVLMVALMRSRTSWYMSFALMPALAACLAGALRITTEAPRLRWLGPVVCALVVIFPPGICAASPARARQEPVRYQPTGTPVAPVRPGHRCATVS
jgi:4-amino-4-deoxy-L-arabinose transferase-like glycosyltransferase